MSHGLELLATKGTREVVHDAAMNFKLPATVKNLVETYATEKKETAAQIVRDALSEYFERRGY